MTDSRPSNMPTQASFLSTRQSPMDGRLDFYPTPPWATRALCERLPPDIGSATVWEPACGRLDMVRPLREYFGEVIYSDVKDYGQGAPLCEFVDEGWATSADWIITNPPFNKWLEFVLKALERAEEGVAMLARTNILEGADRYRELFSKTPPTRTLQFVERVAMLKERLDPDGGTMTSYMWIVWEKGCERRPMEWIEPCRSRLERPGDYDQYLEPLPLLAP